MFAIEKYWRKVVGRADCPEHIRGKTIFDLKYLFILLSELNETSKPTWIMIIPRCMQKLIQIHALGEKLNPDKVNVLRHDL